MHSATPSNTCNIGNGLIVFEFESTEIVPLNLFDLRIKMQSLGSVSIQKGNAPRISLLPMLMTSRLWQLARVFG